MASRHSTLDNMTVPRSIRPCDFGRVESGQLHAFSDASDRGYGIAVYARVKNEVGGVFCTLLLAKSCVAPIKKVSIPRLELTAANLSVKFMALITSAMDLQVDVYYWTDSTSVLSYIANRTSRFHTFVANRVTAIQEGSEVKQWRYVPTAQNPADAASRGLRPKDDPAFWFSGPQFLRKPASKWPKQQGSSELSAKDPEVRQAHAATLKTPEDAVTVDQLIDGYSDWRQLTTTVAWILRAQRLFKEGRPANDPPRKDKGQQPSSLTVADLEAAGLQPIKYVQGGGARAESVRKLAPIMDQEGLLRVGGRLRHSKLPRDARHPIILPNDSHLARLILIRAHQRVGHLGTNSTLCEVRKKYWIPRASRLVRSIIAKCVTCRRYRGRLQVQKMADLPEERLEPDQPPFRRSGVDYFGPFEVKRGRSSVKRYGVIFTCMASRAVHLEVAQDLTTDSCINAVRRFQARRADF